MSAGIGAWRQICVLFVVIRLLPLGVVNQADCFFAACSRLCFRLFTSAADVPLCLFRVVATTDCTHPQPSFVINPGMVGTSADNDNGNSSGGEDGDSADWEEGDDGEGNTFYHNNKTGESRWVKPKV
jgi:hypothetical protein